jgi:hypothetical protein
MFSAYPAAIQLDLAILFTALAWSLGFFVATRKFHLFSSLAIGCFVVLIGYTLGDLHAPAWLVIAGCIPFDLFLLWYVMRTWRNMLIAYPSIWVIYILFHLALSRFLRYDFLIPSWKLHS